MLILETKRVPMCDVKLKNVNDYFGNKFKRLLNFEAPIGSMILTHAVT